MQRENEGNVEEPFVLIIFVRSIRSWQIWRQESAKSSNCTGDTLQASGPKKCAHTFG